MLNNEIENAFRDRPLSIIIPAWNEEKRICATMKRIVEYMEERQWKYEIILVDDGSSDATGEAALAAAPGARIKIVRNETNMGKGASVRRGMIEAAGDAMLFTDADLSTPIEDIEKLIPHWLNGAGVAFGSRAVEGSDLLERQSVIREYMGRTFNLLIQALALPGYIDTQCGFKLFSADCARRVFPQQRLTRFAFDVEVLAVARKLGFDIREVPVSWRNDPSSKVSILRSPVEMILEVFKLKWLLLRNVYK